MAQAYVQTAIETDGRGDENTSPTLSTKKYFTPAMEFSVDPGVSHLDRSDEVRNSDEDPAVITEKKDPTWSVRGRAYPDMLGMYFWLLFGDPTTTQGDGAAVQDPDGNAIPASVYRHVWTAPFGPTGGFPLTADFQPAWEDQSFYARAKGAGIASMSLTTPDTGGMSMEANGPALYLDDQSDPSLTPAYESLSIQPFLYSHMSLSADLSGAASAKSCNLTIEQPLVPDRDLGEGSEWANEMYRGDGPIRIAGTIERALIDLQDWNALMAATGFGLTVRWVSQSIVASSFPYKLYFAFDNAQYVGGGPSGITNTRRIPASFNFRATYDGSGASTTITLINGTSSYS